MPIINKTNASPLPTIPETRTLDVTSKVPRAEMRKRLMHQARIVGMEMEAIKEARESVAPRISKKTESLWVGDILSFTK